MSSLARTNWVAQQRVDLHHLLAMESYTAFDFRAIITAFTGEKPFVLRGFEIIGKTGLAITVKVADSLVFNPLDGNGSFYKGLPDDQDIIIDLPTDQENLFVQVKFRNETRNPINTAYWDPLALTGDDVAGTEYSASANTQVVVVATVTVNTIGFDEDAIPIARVSTEGSNVTKIIDCRPMLFRLGTGGTTPDGSHKFPWGTSRREPVYSGIGVGDDVNSPFRAKDQSGIINDKGIRSFKEWADAVMTRISEISGSSVWYTTDASPGNPLYGYITGLNIDRVWLDSPGGHSIQPSTNASIKWTRNNAGKLVLRSNGTETIKWQANYSPVSWELGGQFTNNVPGGTRTYSSVRFESPAPRDYGNIYLLLSRDVPPPLASGNAVLWAYTNPPSGFQPARTVFGVVGDFTGIAVGDWIRKASEGFSQYYRVVRMSDNTTVRATEGDIADSSVIALELDRDIASGASTEPMLYFRARYSQADLVADPEPSTIGYNYRDLNYYWIGRRVGDTLILRDYGNLQEGEETLVLEDAFLAGGHTGGEAGSNELMLEHAFGASYDTVSGYFNRVAPTGPLNPLLKIRRRKRDNTIPSPGPTSNANASLEYTIEVDVGAMNVGDGLWVRLSDTVGGVLTNGSVTDQTADDENAPTPTNRWEVRSPANNPLRNFDNKDVYLLARRIVTPNGLNGLAFVDGTVLLDSLSGVYDPFGAVINNYFEVVGKARALDDVYLNTKTPKSVLFIDQTPDANGPGRIDEDNAAFNYNKATKELVLFNNTFGINYHRINTPANQNWFVGLGAHTLTIGDTNSNVVIAGDLTVLGVQTIVATQEVSIADKQFIIGVGNLNYGGSGSGLYVADNTIKYNSSPIKTTLLETYSGQSYVDISFDVDPDYRIGQRIGIVSNFNFNGITLGDASLTYVGTVGASSSGQFDRISPNDLSNPATSGPAIYRFWTKGVATSSGTQLPDASHDYQVFDLLSQIHMASSNHEYAISGQYYMTSWSFCVKRYPNDPGTNNNHIPALVTPYESAPFAQDFMTIPKCRSHGASRIQRTRIPFAWEDGVGALGSDSTFDFTDRLTWNYNTNTFRVEGTFVMKGNILPADDNTWDLGSTTARWRDIHAGPGSVIVHNDTANTNWLRMRFGSGGVASLDSDSDTQLYVGVTGKSHFRCFTDGRGSFASVNGNSLALFTLGDSSQLNPQLSGTSVNGLMVWPSLSSISSTTSLYVGLTLSTGNTAADAHLIRLNNPGSVGGGSTTFVYGLYIPAFTAGAASFGIYSSQPKVDNRYFLYSSGSAISVHVGNIGIGNISQSVINLHRLVIGGLSDTTPEGGILLGGDVNIYRSFSNLLRIGDKARIDDSVGIGSDPIDSAALYVTPTSSVSNGFAYGVSQSGKFSATSVDGVGSFSANLVTADFGLATVIPVAVGYHFKGAVAGTNVTITDSYGFLCDNFGASNNTNCFGFVSKIDAGDGKWGFYTVGNATNYMKRLGLGNNNQSTLNQYCLVVGNPSESTTPADGILFGPDVELYRDAIDRLRLNDALLVMGKVGVGIAPASNVAVNIGWPSQVTGNDVIGVFQSNSAPQTASNSITSFYSAIGTADFATPTVIQSLVSYRSATPSIGANATVTYGYGFLCTGWFDNRITTKIAFCSEMTAGSGSWGLYFNGDATNYLAGNLGIGNSNQSAINLQRLLIGTSTDTTPAGGISFGTDTNLYRKGSGKLATTSKFCIESNMLSVGEEIVEAAHVSIKAATPLGYGGSYGQYINIAVNKEATSYGVYSKVVTPSYGSSASCSVRNFASADPFAGTNLTFEEFFGFYQEDVTAPRTLAAAFASSMESGSGKWAFYGGGTAPSYFGGSISLGETNYSSATSASLVFAAGTTPDKGILFGSGLSNLYRSAADTLKTDGNFVVAGSSAFIGNILFNGALSLNYGSVKTTNYTVTATDCVIPINSTAGPSLTIQLPEVTSSQKGRLLIFKDVAGKAGWHYIYLAPFASNKIDGSSVAFRMDQNYMSISLVCNGVDGWDII